MTPEQRQAVVDKIMRMAVRIEPVDLRYDVNNDGKVSSADAFRVHTGTEATDITNLARSLDGWQPLGTDWEWVWNQYTSLGEHGVIKNKVTGEQYLTKPSPQGDKESIQKQAESLVYILNAPELADRVKTYSIAIPWRAVDSGIVFPVESLPDLSDPSYIQNLTKEAGIYRLQGQLASVVDPNSSGGAWSDKPGKSSGPGFGPMGFLAVMAENLYNQTGLTDLNKLGYGKINTPENAPVVRQEIYDSNYEVTGYRWATPTADFATDENGFLVSGGYRALSPEEIKTIKDVGNGRYTADVVVGREGYYNKDTGKKVNFNGTLGGYGEGFGWTSTSLDFKDGKPVLKTTGQDTSDLGTIMPIISLALLAFPGIGQAVGSLLVPAGTSAAVTAAVGSAVVNAGIQIASGVPVEDALKTAAITLAVPSIIPDLTSSAVLNNAIRSAATSIALGADPEKAILSSVMSAAATSIGSKLSLTGQKGVDQAIANALGSVVKNVALGQDITEALTQGAINAAVAAGVESLGAGQNLTKDEKSVLTVAANAIVNAARTGQFNPLQIAGQLSAIGLSKADAAKTVAAEAANLPKSNTAIGAIAVDNSGELFVMDDDGNRMMLSGVAAGRVYTPDEWVSIKGALNAGQAQYVNSLISAMNKGVMTPEEVAEDLHESGYSDDTTAKIFSANEQYIYRANQAQKIAQDYSAVGSDIDRDNAINQIKVLGYSVEEATGFIDKIDRQVAARNDYANVARDFVANNLGTSEQAITKLRDSLTNVGVTGDQQDEVVDAYNKMRLQAAGSDLTPSEMTNLAVLAAKKTGWVAIPGTSGHEVAFELTEEGDPRVVAARDKNGNNLLNQYQNLTPQGVMQVVNAQLALARAAEQTKGAPNQYAVDKEVSDAAVASGLVKTTGLIRNHNVMVVTDRFNNLLRQYSAMSPEDRAKIESAPGVTLDLYALKDIHSQYKEIDKQYAAAVANKNTVLQNLYRALDTRVENKAGYYYTNNGVQPSTAMAMAIQDLQGGNLFNRVNLSEFEDSKFPFETKQFINQFRGNPIGDKLSDVLANAYAIGAQGITNSLNGGLGISLHIAETFGLDSFAEDFQKMSLGLRQAGEDATTIAGADTREHKNFIGGLSNLVSAIPWLMAGPAGIPGLLASVGSTSYGNEYLNGRLAGRSIEDSSERATYMAFIEMVTERFGLSDLTKLLKPVLQNVPTNQIAKVASESIVPQLAKYMTKEQIGELTAFSLQFATDKYADVGLNKQSTGLDFLQGAIDTIQQTFWAAGAAAGIPIGLRGGMTPDNSGSIKVISPDGSQGLVELGNGSVIRVDLPSNLGLKVGEQVNVNALLNDVVYVPDNVNEKFANLQQQVNNAYLNELNRAPTFEELDFNVKRLANGATLDSVITELNNTPQGKLLDDQRAFTSQTDAQIAANAKSLLDQGKTTYADFKTFMDSMGLASDRQLNVLDTITPRANVAGTVTSIIGDNAVVTGTDGQMYTMLRVAPNNYLMQVGDQVKLGVSTVKPTATPTVEVTTKIADVIAASVSTSTSVSLSQSVSQAAVSTSISKSQSLSVSYSQSESLSISTAVSVSESQSKSVSLSQSISTVDMEKSISVSKSLSVSTSSSLSQSISSSLSQSVSASTSTSQSLSTSVSKAVSVSEALSLSTSVSEQIERDRLIGLSISASVSESISKAVSVSESISKAVSVSESTSASISTSQSVSKATSISQSLSASVSQSESVSKATSISASVSESTSASISASTSQSISVSQEVSKQVSISQSTSQSVALSQSVSQDQAVSLAASISQSTSQSISEALSISEEAQAMLNASISQSQSISQEISANVIRGMSISASVSEALSISQSISELIEASISVSLSQAATISVTEAISISETVAPTLSITQSLSIEPSVAPTVAPTISATQQITQTESFTQTPSLTMVITTTSLPPVTTTEVATTEPLTTVIETTITVPPVTPPPTSGTIPPVTPPITTQTISIAETTSPPPATTTSPPATTTSPPPTTTARPAVTTTRPTSVPFPLFGLPAVGSVQQKTYVDYAQPNVPAPEFGPYDLFKAPNYLRPLQDSGNFGLAALIGAASESQQRNGNNQSQQNAESQGQAPTG